VASLSVTYYGFTTTGPPFDEPKVRQAFGKAVDWRRIAALSGTSETVQVANSMVPPGIPGRSATDFMPTYDPAEARRLLAEAGYPGGAGFPDTVLLTGGSGFVRAVIGEVKRELGITVRSETMDDGYFDRLSSEPPAMWSLGWVADYPGRNDFLGVLLGTGASNNYGHWSSKAFDEAIAEAVSSTDAAAAAAAYDRAEAIVSDEVPVVPVIYGPGWALSRTGLLGAGQNGLGSLRMAGLAWAD
jgi:oligopeptide transport system substrate-binding protein